MIGKTYGRTRKVNGIPMIRVEGKAMGRKCNGKEMKMDVKAN